MNKNEEIIKHLRQYLTEVLDKNQHESIKKTIVNNIHDLQEQSKHPETILDVLLTLTELIRLKERYLLFGPDESMQAVCQNIKQLKEIKKRISEIDNAMNYICDCNCYLNNNEKHIDVTFDDTTYEVDDQIFDDLELRYDEQGKKPAVVPTETDNDFSIDEIISNMFNFANTEKNDKIQIKETESCQDSCKTVDAKEAEIQPNSKYEFVNHPSHYNLYPIEVIDMMVKVFGAEKTADWALMTAFKYRMRVGQKPTDDVNQDLKKEKWYLQKYHELKNDL